jgi:two-component system sensor histidine kinase KdpD
MIRLAAARLPRVRALAGAGCGAAGLAIVTALLVPARGHLGLAEVVLIYLVPVLAAAAIGGLWPALLAAVAADVVVNFFFVPPYHTLLVASPEHVTVLVVYVLIAASVSLAVDLAARDRARAARRATEVRLLANASAAPVADDTLDTLLTEIQEAFGMTTVALLESKPTGEQIVAAVGPPSESRPALSAPAGNGLRLVAWGPEMFAEDQRSLQRMAAAAARTLEAQRLSQRAARAQELAEIDEVRAALLAAVGHDLRTPLAGIKAAVSSLRQPDISLPAEAQAELLTTIEESGDQLINLVENLLSLSRVQAGALSVHLDAVALDAVVAQAVLSSRSARGQILLDVGDDLPRVHADAGLLERVISNVLSNAAAASPPGGAVRVSATNVDGEVRLSIVDHGPGVPVEEHDRIFEPFQRLHDRSTTAGLGLGLAIARGFTEAMGGRINADETPGGGLTMTITLRTVSPRTADSVSAPVRELR